MELKAKKPITLYLDISIFEILNTYCYLAKRNKTRVLNEAIREYLSEDRMHEQYLKEGIIK